MRKVIGVLTLVVILFSTITAHAKDMSNKIGFGANWFYYLENDAEFDGDDVINEDTGAAFNIHTSYCLPQPTKVINLNLVLDWEYISRDITIDDDVDPLSDDLGTLTMMPLMLTAQARFANLGIVVPYLGFGLGISFNSISKGEWAEDVEDGLEAIYGVNFDVNYEVDHSFAFKVPIGVDIFVTDNIAFNVEAKYFYTKPSVDIEIEALGLSIDEDDEVDQSTFSFGLGASYYF